MSSNMGFTVNWSVGLTALFMLLICVSMILCDEVKSFDFDVKPGGARNHFETEQWHGITCKFTYVCQGGTDEHWLISLRRDDDFDYKCVIERPEGKPPSYLFFQEFQVDVTGAKVENAEVEGKKLLDTKEYIVDRANNKVKNSDKFQSALNRVDIFLKRQKGTHDDL